MTAYEMMLSECQERMLMILKPGREAEAEAIFRKWGLDFAVIGKTTDTGRMIVTHKGTGGSRPSGDKLANSAPLYERPWVATVPPKVILPEWVPAPNAILDTLKTMMGTQHLCSRRWIWEQYDHMVMGDTVQRPGGDAAVVRVHGTTQGPRSHLRRDAPLRRRRSGHGHQAGRGRDLAQPDRRRCRPARHHRQHELRQPGAARGHGPVRRRRRRA